ncbi:MAG: RNA-binding domain-containing protein [Nitrososphaeria archaeon]
MERKYSGELELELSFNVHATEDERRLLGILEKNFDLREPLFSKTIFEGYHGNRILKYGLSVKGSLADKVFVAIFKKLDSLDRERLLSDIGKNIDSAKIFYLRLDKSSLFEEKFRLGESNAFHFKFKPRIKYLKDARAFYTRLILETINVKQNV